jgi:type III secretion protein V
LSAIAAGLIVTRTAGDDSDRHLGASIARELRGHPRVPLIGGILAILLALVPGFPWPVFLVLGFALLGSSAWRHRNDWQPLHALLVKTGLTTVPAATEPQAAAAEARLGPPATLLVEVPQPLLDREGREALLAATTRAVERLREEYGAPIPPAALRVSASLGANSYRLTCFGLRIVEAELPTESPLGALESALTTGLRRHLSQFAGIQETSNLLNTWSRDYPDLVKEMLRAAAPQRVSEVLRRLLDEGIPIRHLRDVFEAITEISARERDIILVTEHVRVALRRYITQRHMGVDGTISALIAHPELEDMLRQAVRAGGQSAQIAVDPQLLQRVHAEIQSVRNEFGTRFAGVTLLCSMDIRRHLRRITEAEFFELPVLSFQELSADAPVIPVGQIRG